MNLRRKSLAELHIERDALQAEMAAHAARLPGRQASAEQFAPALMPGGASGRDTGADPAQNTGP